MIAVMDKKEKAVIRIAVSANAKKVVEKWANHQDMTEIGVASRIYEWFGQQPEAVQRAILGLLGGFTGDVSTLVLHRMAGGTLGEDAVRKLLDEAGISGRGQGNQSRPHRGKNRGGPNAA